MSLNFQRLRQATTPTVEWGPALVKHRRLVAKYVPGFVVDPWGKEEPTAVMPEDINLQVTMLKCLVILLNKRKMKHRHFSISFTNIIRGQACLLYLYSLSC